ncbi:DUT nucleotidohydrolase, partial [Tyrannus savana]|nr:DUT nucleotidohydrolase [Tyrannus savana]
SGSLGLDLAAAVDTILFTTEPQTISTGVQGPLIINNKTMGALLVGRSSLSLAGLFVLPGVIDADYAGEIKIMAYTPFPPIKIEQGQRIAQLIPLPQFTSKLCPLTQKDRGERGFGSTGHNILLTLDLSSRPKQPIVLQWENEQYRLDALLDTGADSSIIS